MTLGLFLLATALVTAAPGADNPVYVEVTRTGVQVGGKEPVRVPLPTMADGLDAKAQEKLIAEIAGKGAVPRFIRNSAVAPHVVKMRELEGDEGHGRVVSAWFVAHGEIDQFSDKKFREQMLSAGDDPEMAGQGGALDAAQLKNRGIPWKDADSDVEAYSHGSLSLLKKVKVAATIRTYSSRTDDSVIFAAMIDPRFAEDPDFPNNWAPITRTPTGGVEVGKPRPYGGLGTYLKATRLAAPAGAILVECHLVFSEPEEWFGGANLLGAKIPAIVQSRVRDVRRELNVTGKHSSKK